MEQIGFAIKAIKETEYFVDESMEVGEQFNFLLNSTINSKTDIGEIHFTISVNYQKKDTSEDFLRGRITSIFIIENMKSRVQIIDGKETVNLPDQLWATIFSISYSHARAMLARSSAGTKYSHMILPLINPEEQFRKIFKKELDKNPQPIQTAVE